MNLTPKAAHLAKLIALISAAYLPQAHADLTVNLGKLPPAFFSIPIVDNRISSGSFTDAFNFSTGAELGNIIAGTAISYSITYDVTDPNEIGATLSSIGLYQGAIELNPHGAVSFTQTSAVDPVSGDTFWKDTFKATLATVFLSPNSSYSLIITGNGGSQNDSIGYSGHFTGTFTDVLPEPEQWAMLLLGLPVTGWAARRKRANQT